MTHVGSSGARAGAADCAVLVLDRQGVDGASAAEHQMLDLELAAIERQRTPLLLVVDTAATAGKLHRRRPTVEPVVQTVIEQRSRRWSSIRSTA